MKQLNRHTFVLDSGRTLETYGDIIGLSADLDAVYYGYDGTLTEVDWTKDGMKEVNPLTEAERRELSDFMIALWERYAREGVTPK